MIHEDHFFFLILPRNSFFYPKMSKIGRKNGRHLLFRAKEGIKMLLQQPLLFITKGLAQSMDVGETSMWLLSTYGYVSKMIIIIIIIPIAITLFWDTESFSYIWEHPHFEHLGVLSLRCTRRGTRRLPGLSQAVTFPQDFELESLETLQK